MRESRNKIQKEKIEMLTYIDPLELGSSKDPCFGKHYSLTATECTICGDAVFCANKQSIKLKSLVIKEEAKEVSGKFVDTNLRDLTIAAANKYIAEKAKKGMNRKLLFKMAKKKYKLPNEQILSEINKYY